MYAIVALRRLRRAVLIYRVVQLLFCILLIFMALHFQQLFAEKGLPHVFRNSLLVTLLLQFMLFFPLRRFADKEARRELAAASAQTTAEQQKQLRQQRLLADVIKGAVFLGFTTFIMMAPPVTFVLSTALFCFIVTVLTYLQCFNFVVRRELGNQPSA